MSAMVQTEIKAVLVGCGGMSQAWLGPAMKVEGLSIVGLVDINPQAAARRAAEYGLGESVVYPTLAEALQKARPSVVFDVTVPAAHKNVTLEALAAGCHVLGEKPMSDSLDNAREMVQAAKKAGKLYAVIQNRRYQPNIRRVRQVVADGVLGKLSEMNVDFFLGPHFGGFREEMAHPLLVDMAIHTFDQARYISQADPVWVYCHAFNPGHSWFKGDTSAVVIFEMTDNLVYTYRGSWCAQGLPTSWEGHWRLIGSKGTLLWEGEGNITASVLAPSQNPNARMAAMVPAQIPPMELAHQTHDGLIREFIDCVRQGGTPLTHCEDNIKSLAMVLAAVKSAETGQREKVVW
jgi:predicted dehydrogenase